MNNDITHYLRQKSTPPNHACSFSHFLLLSLLLSGSELCAHTESPSLAAHIGPYLACQHQQMVRTIRLSNEEKTHTSAHKHTHEHSHTRRMQRHNCLQKKGCCSQGASVDLIKMTGLASSTHVLCIIPAEADSECKDRLSPGLYNYGSIISLLLPGLQAVRNYRRV